LTADLDRVLEGVELRQTAERASRRRRAADPRPERSGG
jgi:hypothetical protein